jgi:hypothetical protein
MIDLQDLKNYPLNYSRERKLSQEEILHWFEISDACWFHDGDPESPHAELASGFCSNGYISCPQLLKMPNVNYILANQLAMKLKHLGVKKDEVQWAVGSAYSAITFSYEVAKILNLYHGYTQKDINDPQKQVWKKFEIPEGATVLQIEELITTSNTFRAVRKAIRKGNRNHINFLPIIGTLVHRPPEKRSYYIFDDEGKKVEAVVVALIEKEIWAVDPLECPLCRAGSKRYKPKENWEKLTGKK